MFLDACGCLRFWVILGGLWYWGLGFPLRIIGILVFLGAWVVLGYLGWVGFGYLGFEGWVYRCEFCFSLGFGLMGLFI